MKVFFKNIYDVLEYVLNNNGCFKDEILEEFPSSEEECLFLLNEHLIVSKKEKIFITIYGINEIAEHNFERKHRLSQERLNRISIIIAFISLVVSVLGMVASVLISLFAR